MKPFHAKPLTSVETYMHGLKSRAQRNHCLGNGAFPVELTTLNAMRKVLAQEPGEGVFVCASAGNHAQGVAYACRHFGVHGVIFMPVTTPRQKIQKTRIFGGDSVEIRMTGDYFDDTLAAVGTTNLDNRSFRLNFEAMALFFDARAAEAVDKMLRADFEKCYELTRNLSEQPPHIRFGSPLARLFAPIL